MGTYPRTMSGSGAHLALLLLGSYRKMVDSAVAELAARGYADVRPSHDYAMRAIAAGADSASELGRRMSMSKQAAAKIIALLTERGYVRSAPDPTDRRRKRLEVTQQGSVVMRVGEAIFDELRCQWQAEIGHAQLAALEAQLAAIVGGNPVRVEAPGWVATST